MKIGIHGVNGKMGQKIAEAVLLDPSCTLSVVSVRQHHSWYNRALDEVSDIKIACLFEEIGRIPNSDVIDGLEKDSDGYILVNDSFETNIPNVFAIGDVIAKTVRQIVTATSDGAQAAIAISRRVK